MKYFRNEIKSNNESRVAPECTSQENEAPRAELTVNAVITGRSDDHFNPFNRPAAATRINEEYSRWAEIRVFILDTERVVGVYGAINILCFFSGFVANFKAIGAVVSLNQISNDACLT